MLLLLMVLLSSLSSYAQKMVGDGFGGRAGYSPVNLVQGQTVSGVICSDKTLTIWAWTDYMLNNGTSPNTSTPTQVTNVSNVRQVAMGLSSATYIKEDGTGYVLGRPTPYNNSIISNAYHTDASSAGRFAFVKTDGTVWTGGGNGAFSPNCTCINNQPATYCSEQLLGFTNVKRVALAYDCNNLVALLADGTVKTIFGASSYYPTSLISSTPLTIPGLSNIVDVKASKNNYYALTSSGQVYSWGGGTGMGTGVAADLTQYTPQLITFPAGAAPIKAIVPSRVGKYCLALDENGVCYVWGTDFKDAGVTYYSTPQVIATNVRDMVAGNDYSCE